MAYGQEIMLQFLLHHKVFNNGNKIRFNTQNRNDYRWRVKWEVKQGEKERSAEEQASVHACVPQKVKGKQTDFAVCWRAQKESDKYRKGNCVPRESKIL